MKKSILLFNFLIICLAGIAQTYTSNKLSMWDFKNDKLIISDNSGKQLLTIESNFKKYKKLKKKIKIFKLNNQTHFITKAAKGTHLVYTHDWELIARITTNGEEIVFPNEQKFYKKKVNNNWFGKYILNYLDTQDNEIASIQVGKKNRLEYTNLNGEQTDFLLMALSFHQLQEKMNRDKKNQELFLLTTDLAY